MHSLLAPGIFWNRRIRPGRQPADGVFKNGVPWVTPSLQRDHGDEFDDVVDNLYDTRYILRLPKEA